LDSDPESDLDLLARGTDPGIRIRTKMSRILNTEKFAPRIRNMEIFNVFADLKKAASMPVPATA
jgi:hypothetical protein